MIQHSSSNAKCHVTTIKKTGEIKVFQCQITERNSGVFSMEIKHRSGCLGSCAGDLLSISLCSFVPWMSSVIHKHCVCSFCQQPHPLCHLTSSVLSEEISVKVKVDISDSTVLWQLI